MPGRTFDASTLGGELARARGHGWDRICRAIERKTGLPAGLLLAVASRETDMNDVAGDGGHGRGLFQIDDRSHGAFLASHGAGGPGGLPPVDAAAEYAAALLDQNHAYGRSKGVRERDRWKFALSAYNAGPKGALDGYREGDSDRKTTGGDYGRDVLERHAIFERLLGVGGTRDRVLRRGSRGRRVARLKERLAAWFAENPPDAYAANGVNAGPYFGRRLERAVCEFQRRNDLDPDGEVGPLTLAALEE